MKKIEVKILNPESIDQYGHWQMDLYKQQIQNQQ